MNDHLISVHSIKCQLCQARLNKEFDQHICDLQSMDPAANKNEIIKHIRINDVEVGLISKSFQSPKNVNSKGEKHQCLKAIETGMILSIMDMKKKPVMYIFHASRDILFPRL